MGVFSLRAIHSHCVFQSCRPIQEIVWKAMSSLSEKPRQTREFEPAHVGCHVFVAREHDGSTQ